MRVHRRNRIAVALAMAFGLALGGCYEGTTDVLPPLDRFYFPVGLATTRVTRVTPGDTAALLVSSSNYDLRYAAVGGGALLSVDSDGAVASPGALTPLGSQRIGSYSGPVAVADGTTCPGIGSPVAFVASRYDDEIYKFGIGTLGELTCGPDCVRPARSGFDDPYSTAVACGSGFRRAYVAYLDPPAAGGTSDQGAWITEFDLDASAALPREILLGDGPVRAMAYDRSTDRLWATTLSSGARALLHSAVLSDPRWNGISARDAVDTIDLWVIRGAELRAIAIGSSPVPGVTRLYLTARLYDAEAQITSSFRPAYDLGGVLIVLDVANTRGMDGKLEFAFRDVFPLGRGVGDVVVVKRAEPVLPTDPPAYDLVVATAGDEDRLVVYDDLTGGVVHDVAYDPIGVPILGDRPLALAVDQSAAGDPAQVYVAGFAGHRVTRFLLDPAAPSQPLVLEPIGGLAP